MKDSEAREAWLAPAKINLWLAILGRRPDGYHQIDTAYQAIDLADTVVLEPAPEGVALECRVDGEAAAGVPEGDENLAARAARLLALRTGHVLRVRLTVVKAIPPGAGLGGGSSDAAATLMALAHRFAVPDPEHTLRALAAEIGADVPFFLEGGTQRARGVGEDLAPLELPAERWGVLVHAGVSVATGWAYRAWDETRGGRTGRIQRGSTEAPRAREPATAGEDRSLPPDWRERGNDFEAIVFERHPEIRRAAEMLASGPAVLARLCGSGGAVFALYAEEVARNCDLERVRREAEAISRSARVWPFACIDHGVEPLPTID